MLWELKRQVVEKCGSQANMARALRVHPRVISEIMHERRRPDYLLRVRMAKLLSVSLETLTNMLGGESE